MHISMGPITKKTDQLHLIHCNTADTFIFRSFEKIDIAFEMRLPLKVMLNVRDDKLSFSSSKNTQCK